MPEFIFTSLEYKEVFKSALCESLSNAGFAPKISGAAVSVSAEKGGESALARAVSDALAALAEPETRRLLRLLPIGKEERESVSARAAELAGRSADPEYLRGSVESWLKENRLLIAEGFLRFRAPRVVEAWAAAADRAAAELLEPRESGRLLALLGMLTFDEGAELLRLVVYGDGSWAISDPFGARMEGRPLPPSEMILFLISLRPGSLEVCDLKDGGSRALIRGIRAAFGKRARIFIKRVP